MGTVFTWEGRRLARGGGRDRSSSRALQNRSGEPSGDRSTTGSRTTPESPMKRSRRKQCGSRSSCHAWAQGKKLAAAAASLNDGSQSFFHGQNALGRVHEFLIIVSGQLLQPLKGFFFFDMRQLHQQALGAFNDFPISQRLAQVIAIVLQCLQFTEPPHSNGDRRRQIGNANRLDEIRLNVVC